MRSLLPIIGGIAVGAGLLGLFSGLRAPSYHEHDALLLSKASFLTATSHVPNHYLDVRDVTGRHVVWIDEEGRPHPDWRRKFNLLRHHCHRGCCTGDVREGKRTN
jgi:hypothetical protein